MTKPKPTPDIIITLRIPRDVDAVLTELAERNERTKAAVIRLAIREYLDRRPT
ncbi:MAG: CopG family transcriptional regulator [Chloroflexi bacterium]|nr:CopG family transcriptional regulator [Chloroflexota bacterium]